MRNLNDILYSYFNGFSVDRQCLVLCGSLALTSSSDKLLFFINMLPDVINNVVMDLIIELIFLTEL